jgi:hypothetical protein
MDLSLPERSSPPMDWVFHFLRLLMQPISRRHHSGQLEQQEHEKVHFDIIMSNPSAIEDLVGMK